MESGGEKGRINVSEATKNLLETDDLQKDNYRYNYTPNKPVTIASLNKEFKCYFIENEFTRNHSES